MLERDAYAAQNARCSMAGGMTSFFAHNRHDFRKVKKRCSRLMDGVLDVIELCEHPVVSARAVFGVEDEGGQA